MVAAERDNASNASSEENGKGGLGYQVREEQKIKEQMESKIYELKMKVYDLTRQLKNRQNSPKDNTLKSVNESRMYEPDLEQMDAHRKMLDFELSDLRSDNDSPPIDKELYSQLLEEKIALEEKLKKAESKSFEFET